MPTDNVAIAILRSQRDPMPAICNVSFPSIKFWLMIGIGGGVPSEEIDIRLGDVGVSVPGELNNGMIDYHYRRTTGDGEFERKGSLERNP